MAWLRKRSQTIDQLSRLISYLPQERRKALWQILPISVLPGLLDLALVAVGARLVGP